MVNDDLVLSDDELVAMAVHGGGGWPARLPTVDFTDDEIRPATFRGGRSLSIRGLMDNHGRVESPAASRIYATSADAAYVEVFVSELSFTLTDWRFVYRFLPPPLPVSRSWLVNEVSEFGVHRFNVDDHDVIRTFIIGFITAASTAYHNAMATGESALTSPTSCVVVRNTDREVGLESRMGAYYDQDGAPVSDQDGELERRITDLLVACDEGRSQLSAQAR